MGGAPSSTREPTQQSSVPQAVAGQVSGPLPVAVPSGTASTMHRQARACLAAGGGVGCRSPEPQCSNPCVNAVTSQGDARHAALPPPPHPHQPPGTCPPCGATEPPAPPAQPMPWEGDPVGRGGHISGAAEPPEQCQHHLLLWETTSRRGRNLAGLQTSSRAAGISLQRLFFQVIYFQVWSVRATPILR